VYERCCTDKSVLASRDARCVLQDEPASAADKPASREPPAPASFATAASAYAQDLLYTNGGLNYNVRGYGAVGGGQQTPPAALSNGKTDLDIVHALDEIRLDCYG